MHDRNHPVPADITDAVVYIQQAYLFRVIVTFHAHVSGHEASGVVFSFHKHVYRLAVGVDTGHTDFTKLICQRNRFLIRLSAAFCRLLESLVGIIYPKGQNFNAIAMLFNMFADRRRRVKPCGEHNTDFSLLQHIGCAVSHTRFRSGIGYGLEAEGRFVIVCCLLGITHIKFNVIGTVDGQKVVCLRDFFGKC